MHTRRRFRSHAGRPGRYPLATVAAYGPNTDLATKLVVSLFNRPEQRDAPVMRTWHARSGDVRHDVEIAAEVAAFVKGLGANQTVATDRIIGCPHEEGIDYPIGRVCPQCPAWAGLDRFTHEPIVVDPPTMTATEVLEALSADRTAPPREALVSADAHREALFAPLAAAVERGLAAPRDASIEDAALFSYAVYLFAKWREPRALPLVLRWLSLPGEGPFDIAGDVVTQDGARILAAVSDGDLGPLTRLATNQSANEFARAVTVHALALLAAWGEVPRDAVIGTLDWLAREGLEREPSQVWNELASSVLDIEAWALLGAVRQAFADGFVETQFMHLSEVDDAEASPAGHMLERTRDRYAPIDDVEHATAWWARFSSDDDDVGPNEPYRAPPKVGRNEPCPCGSGKKFKRCCGA